MDVVMCLDTRMFCDDIVCIQMLRDGMVDVVM